MSANNDASIDTFSPIVTEELQLLVEQANAGNEEALNKLLANSHRRLEVIVHKKLAKYYRIRLHGNHTTAVMNDAMVRIWRNYQEVRPATFRQFMGWFAYHVHFALLDIAEKIDRDKTLYVPLESDIAASPDERFLHEPVVLKLLGKLPPRQREVVQLRILDEMPTREVAKCMNISEDTVQRDLKAALVTLAMLLKALEK